MSGVRGSRTRRRCHRPPGQTLVEVRVRIKGRWHNGTAHLVPDDDARARLRELPRFNSAAVRAFGADLLTC